MEMDLSEVKEMEKDEEIDS